MEAEEFEIRFLPLSRELLRRAMRLLGDLEEAKDAVQETFAQAWQIRRRLATMENAEGYVAEILRNYCLKRLRAGRERVSEEVLAMQPDSRPDPAQQAEARSRAELMRRLIASLPPQPARVLTLQVYGEMDSAEIAAHLSLSEANVRKILSRYRPRLAAMYSEAVRPKPPE